jgi:predicted nuclease of predicted toxin-antitoxin system
MKILIDECLPKKLKQQLSEHEVSTVPENGWAGKKNGELLQLMNGEFDVFITVDSNMSYQQQLSDKDVAFIVLRAKTNRLEDLLPLMEKVKTKLETIQSGEVVKVGEGNT